MLPLAQRLIHRELTGPLSTRIDLECFHDQQSARDPAALLLGHDVRVLAQRQPRRLRWSGQLVLSVQAALGQGRRRSAEDVRRACATRGLPLVLPLHQG